jgi:O-methyltransferase
MENSWQQRLRSRLYPFYERLPAGLRNGSRKIFDLLQHPSLSARSHWIRYQYTEFGLEQRRRVFLEIARFAHINRPLEGYYLEFGSHEANTMRMAWDNFQHLFDWHFVAFDSFAGLPEIAAIDQQPIWKKGKLRTAEEDFIGICVDHGMPRDRLTTIRGFFDDSLRPELRDRLLPRKAAVVYIDCDLYQSTVPVLKFIKDFLQQGTVIVFDDWNCFYADPDRGERRAWREFCIENPQLKFEPFVQTGMQMSFIHIETDGSNV